MQGEHNNDKFKSQSYSACVCLLNARLDTLLDVAYHKSLVLQPTYEAGGGFMMATKNTNILHIFS